MTTVKDILGEYIYSSRTINRTLGILRGGRTAHDPCTGIASIMEGNDGWEILEYDNTSGRENIRVVLDLE